MTQYQFNVNGQSVVGALTWSAIGTLESLNITDPFNSANTQNCSYTHDDLVRTASVNCGSIWSQTFTYDPFGNINKTGTYSFQAAYSNLTNHMTLIGTSTPTYDANGNVTNDFLHTFAWDAVGKATTIDGVGVTYDALGRMVEQNRSGSYSQIVYSPTGDKLAIMSGQSLQKAFVALAGGSVAVYNSAGLTYYRHPDPLNSSRFGSTPSRTMYFDGAYAPFGEPYALAGTTDLAFTGMNQDTVSGLYDFPAREYNPVQGRWPSPDPAGRGAAHPDDPRSWNRYAYVLNNPLGLTDPMGLDDCDLAEDGCGIDMGSGLVSILADASYNGPPPNVMGSLLTMWNGESHAGGPTGLKNSSSRTPGDGDPGEGGNPTLENTGIPDYYYDMVYKSWNEQMSEALLSLGDKYLHVKWTPDPTGPEPDFYTDWRDFFKYRGIDWKTTFKEPKMTPNIEKPDPCGAMKSALADYDSAGLRPPDSLVKAMKKACHLN